MDVSLLLGFICVLSSLNVLCDASHQKSDLTRRSAPDSVSGILMFGVRDCRDDDYNVTTEETTLEVCGRGSFCAVERFNCAENTTRGVVARCQCPQDKICRRSSTNVTGSCERHTCMYEEDWAQISQTSEGVCATQLYLATLNITRPGWAVPQAVTTTLAAEHETTGTTEMEDRVGLFHYPNEL